MLSIMRGDEATLRDGLFLMGSHVPTQRLTDARLLGAHNVWHPSPDGLENYATHLLAPASRGFASALETRGSYRDSPNRFKPALTAFLRRLKAVGVIPDEGYADYLLLFNVSSEYAAAYFLVMWPRDEHFTVMVYAREIDLAMLANIKAVDAALTRLARTETRLNQSFIKCRP